MQRSCARVSWFWWNERNKQLAALIFMSNDEENFIPLLWVCNNNFLGFCWMKFHFNHFILKWMATLHFIQKTYSSSCMFVADFVWHLATLEFANICHDIKLTTHFHHVIMKSRWKIDARKKNNFNAMDYYKMMRLHKCVNVDFGLK